MESINTVNLDLEDYEKLVRDQNGYVYLTTLLFNSAELNYNGKELRFETEKAAHLLEALEPARYHLTLKELRAEKEGKK